MGWMQRLSEGLTKTRSAVRGSLDRLLGRAVDLRCWMNSKPR
jgi:fused signal recognition particle receptor